MAGLHTEIYVPQMGIFKDCGLITGLTSYPPMTPGHTLRGGGAIKRDMKHLHGLNSDLFAPYLYNYVSRFYDREIIFQRILEEIRINYPVFTKFAYFIHIFD